MKTTVKNVIEEIAALKKEAGGIKQVYFVACGGSYGALYPANIFLTTESSTLNNHIYNSGEFINNPPKALGENSVLIVTSHKGNTPETVAAAELGKQRGAAVIALTWILDSPITKVSDYVLQYTFGPEKDIGGEKTVVALLCAAEILRQTDGYNEYDKMMDGVAKIDRVVKHACKQVERRAKEFAEKYKDDPVIYTLGSGASYGAAYMESICIFMEMQWINSSAIHSGEFFHGPFEIVDRATPFVIQIAEGETRKVDERAYNFLKKYAGRIEVLDAKELGLSVIDSSVVQYFNHSLFNNIYVVFNQALAEARQHPLTTRRYMWKVEY